MKVVIISQVCYPRLSPRAHRATELAKEMARKGHDVTVYALLGDYNYTEYSEKTGVKFKNLGKSYLGNSDNVGHTNRNIFLRAFNRFFGKYLLSPQIELYPLVKKAVESEDKIDLLVTIAVPHILHYATAKADRRNVGTWIADCGDPFMGNPFHNHPKYFEKFERYWCERCDYITVPVAEAKDAYYPEYREKVRVIPQGFDFENIVLAEYKPNKIPTFCFSGIVYKDLRDPTLFLEYLSQVDYDFKFIVYTKSVKMFETSKEKLRDKLEIRDYIPRDDLLYELSKMDFLINIQNNSGVQQPSKLIDYASTGRPILNITSSFSERDTFEEFIKRNYFNQFRVNNIEDYNVKNVANKFISLIEKK